MYSHPLQHHSWFARNKRYKVTRKQLKKIYIIQYFLNLNLGLNLFRLHKKKVRSEMIALAILLNKAKFNQNKQYLKTFLHLFVLCLDKKKSSNWSQHLNKLKWMKSLNRSYLELVVSKRMKLKRVKQINLTLTVLLHLLIS